MGRAAFIVPPQAPRGSAQPRALGCRLWDSDGAERIDFDMAGGAAILGHAHPGVEAAVAAGPPSETEVRATLTDMLPGSPSVRFTAEESHALPAAIDAARRATGRRRAAVWEAGAGLFGGAGDLAAVVVDPLGVAPADLLTIREAADAIGTVLIFDEGVSGFRVHDGGVQALSGVTPDIAVFGSQIANGRPIGAIAGRWDLVTALDEDDLSQPRPDSLAAAAATLTHLSITPVASHIAVLGAELMAEVGRLSEAAGTLRCFRMAGDPSLPAPLFGAPWLEGLWLREMAARRISIIGPHAISAAHDEAELARLIAAYVRILPLMADQARPTDRIRRGAFAFDARPEGLA